MTFTSKQVETMRRQLRLEQQAAAASPRRAMLPTSPLAIPTPST
jgi:hypothetical protein